VRQWHQAPNAGAASLTIHPNCGHSAESGGKADSAEVDELVTAIATKVFSLMAEAFVTVLAS
jgi:hypothetical protein